MRMFLVGMCDIFLLLYLTALAQLDSRQVSSLTVQDYLILKQSQEQLAQTKSQIEKQLHEKESASARAKEQVALLEKQLKELEAIKAESDRTQREASVRLASLSEQLSNKQSLLAEAAQREKEALKKQAELAQQAQTAAQSAADDKKAKEEALRLAEEARKQEEEAKRAAEKALAEAEEARREQARALLTAEQAQQQEAQAIALRQQAETAAAEARALAGNAREQAARAEQERSMTAEKIKAVTRSGSDAYRMNVRRRILPVDIMIEAKGFLGTSRQKTELSLVPVQFGEERVAVVPLEQTVLADLSTADGVLRLEAQSGSQKAERIYISDSAPRLIGIAFGGKGVSAQPIPALDKAVYMPTLIALRNGSRMALKDRIRNLGEDYFLFERDKLQQKGFRVLQYAGAGFRGTQDFGEHIVPGDQIFDLEGNFIGVSAAENTITQLPTLKNWRSVEVLGRRPEQVAADIIRLTGR